MSAAIDASPWWYRNRFGTIGAVYFVGFFVGNLVTGIVTHATPLPAYVVWGATLGPHGKHVLLLAMAGLVIAAFALRSWGGSYLRPEVVWNADALGDRLLVDGPFRFVRNPLYLGNMLLAMGIGLLAPPLGWVVLVAGNLWIVLGLMQVETTLLRGRYGPAFDAYASAVPALFPRLAPANVPGTAVATPSLAVGLRSEVMTGAIALASIAYAIAHW
jgi:protein-S-isoprenylcysteine O-methyltransferase Ste14